MGKKKGGDANAQAFSMKYLHPCLLIARASTSRAHASRVLVQLEPSSVPQLLFLRDTVQRCRQKKIL